MSCGVPIVFINEVSGHVSREVLRQRDGRAEFDIRQLLCPYSDCRPCTIDCALIAGRRDEGDRLLLLCRGSGKQVILGMPDPERTDLDEMLALTAASDLIAQKQAADEQKLG